MPIFVNDAGVARQIREIWVNDAGVARRIQEIWVNDAGTARRVFEGDQVGLGLVEANRFTIAPTTATATYRLTSAGQIEATTSGGGTASTPWISPQVNMANYEARATLLSGSATTGTFGAWMSLSTTRSWSKQATSGSGLLTVTFTLEIRRASDAVVLDSQTITIQAESQV
jgi:hypothetical protein